MLWDPLVEVWHEILIGFKIIGALTENPSALRVTKSSRWMVSPERNVQNNLSCLRTKLSLSFNVYWYGTLEGDYLWCVVVGNCYYHQDYADKK